VLCLASRRPLDEAACLLLAKLLEKRGVSTRVQPFADVVSAKSFKIDTLDAPLVCLSYFGALGSPAHVRYLIRRLRRVMPTARFLAGFWMLAEQASKSGGAANGGRRRPRCHLACASLGKLYRASARQRSCANGDTKACCSRARAIGGAGLSAAASFGGSSGSEVTQVGRAR
jgi:hypothetical protein